MDLLLLYLPSLLSLMPQFPVLNSLFDLFLLVSCILFYYHFETPYPAASNFLMSGRN